MARGKIMGDLAYGYMLDGDEIIDPVTGRSSCRIVINAVAAPVIPRVHRDYEPGVNPVAIAAALTREGVKTPEGGDTWHLTRLRAARGRMVAC